MTTPVDTKLEIYKMIAAALAADRMVIIFDEYRSRPIPPGAEDAFKSALHDAFTTTSLRLLNRFEIAGVEEPT